MALLETGFALLAMLVLLNLLLTLGVIRRLREQASEADEERPPLPEVGTRVRDFTVTSLAGEPFTADHLTSGSRLVGFFSPLCKPCHRLKDELLARPPSERMFAFVVGDRTDPQAETLAVALSAITEVAMVPIGDRIHEAFDVQGFPALVRVTDGAVTAAAYRTADLRALPARVR